MEGSCLKRPRSPCQPEAAPGSGDRAAHGAEEGEQAPPVRSHFVSMGLPYLQALQVAFPSGVRAAIVSEQHPYGATSGGQKGFRESSKSGHRDPTTLLHCPSGTSRDGLNTPPV